MEHVLNLIIRVVQPSDAQMLRDNVFVRNTLAETEAQIKSNLEEYAKGEVIPLVAEVDGVVVGTAGLYRNPFALYRHRGELKGMVVSPAYQRRGIARRLIEALRAHAAGLGLTIFETGVRGGTPAEEVYRSIGFTEYGRLPGGLVEPWGEQCTFDEVLLWMPIT